MQKQRRRSVSPKRELINQNYSLDASTSSLIYNLMGSISGDDFKTSYLKSEYLSKYADPSPGNSDRRKAAAIAKWLTVEGLNASTNRRISTSDGGFNILPRVTLRQFVKHCRGTIATILGELSDDIVIGGFSGGASTSCRRTHSHPGFKYSDKADVTGEAAPIIDILYRQAPFLRHHSMFSSLREVEGAVMFTVPKNSDIDRCACKEPDINMYLQRGVGNHIGRRLRRVGIDLHDQSINRNLAREGAKDGSLATLDLSSASDSVTIELVRLLLPDLWFEYLNSIRSQKVSVDGDTFTTEMFSSMGNGFTFELESLLFYSIVKSVLYFEGIKGRLSVYGDDIICPTKAYELVTWTLSWFGFTPNHSKSFAAGPFRESCGGHYHNREDVTPFYLKRPAANLTDLIRVANQLRKWAVRSDCGLQVSVNDPSVFTAWSRLRDLVPKIFWGGSDLDLDTQLVTDHAPDQRLSRLSKVKSVPGKGLYAFWQNSNWDRRRECKLPARDVIDSISYCRRRRAPSWGDVTQRHLFIEEVSAMSRTG